MPSFLRSFFLKSNTVSESAEKSLAPYERVFIFVMLFCTVATFFAFGLFHLGKFETTDEHLWKYDRIPAYWQALATHNWGKTYINDKPGVTVALISGIGLLAEPHPEQNEKVSQPAEQEKIFETYNVAQSEKTNITFRLPILIFSSLSLLAFFFLIQSAFQSSLLALLGTMFIAGSPILLGIAQIINPDSFFWIFGGLAATAFIAFQNTDKRRFLILCGILSGFALLSKYTAFILFLLYGILVFSKMIFQDKEKAGAIRLIDLLKRLLEITFIFIISIIVFSLFLPAVFIHPEYLFKGISQFLDGNNLLVLLGGTVIVSVIAFLLRKHVGPLFSFLASKKQTFLISVTLFFLALVALSLLNTWTGERIAPVDLLRDTAYANEPKTFNFKPVLDRKDGDWYNAVELFLLEAHPLIFSLSPLVFLILICIAIPSVRRKISDQAAVIIFSLLLFGLLYLISAQSAKIVTNARYIIILYPLFALLCAVALHEILRGRISAKAKMIGILTLFILGSASLFSLRPFYFSYTNFLLPQSFSIHDSWGHGSYEAAEYLNSLPNAKDLVIWSNSDTVCRFFEGKCLKSRRIDLNRVTPDYFVISKRGAIKTNNRFLLVNSSQPGKDSDYYFAKLENGFIWELLINDRPENFIKIIPFEK